MPQEPELHQAARIGDQSTVLSLLGSGTPVDGRDPSTGKTALMALCSEANAKPAIVELLINHGADVNALTVPPAETPFDSFENLDLEALELEPDELETIKQAQEASRNSSPELQNVLCIAVSSASYEVLESLLRHGADPQARTSSGYTPFILAACANREDAMQLLLEHGASIEGCSSYGESVLSRLALNGNLAWIKKLIEQGADPTPLGWSPLMQAIAIGTEAEFLAQLDSAPDLESRDSLERTPFLLSVHCGHIDKARVLLDRGADPHATGRCARPAMNYAASQDDSAMISFLLDRGFDLNVTDEFGATPAIEASEHNAANALRYLIEAGADLQLRDHVKEGPIEKASDPEVIAILLEQNCDLNALDTEVLREHIGLGTASLLATSKDEYLQNRSPRFGKTNPEAMTNGFWRAMVHCGWSGYQGSAFFNDSNASFDKGEACWCHERFGMSLTPLPDGRFIQIAGEHEDHYDPDFYIYNDVIVHDGQGSFQIYGYPEATFPPTDFHSATLVGEWVYVIGNLGHSTAFDDHSGHTPVYRLNLRTLAMEQVSTSGPDPGWIHEHKAQLKGNCIHISGGKRLSIDRDEGRSTAPNEMRHQLDLSTHCWHQLR